MTVARVLAGEARWHVAESRAEAFLASLPDNCVDLIVTDPPYHRVKDLAWDREHKSATAFLDWLGGIAREWARVLRPNGSIYCFASPQMAARVECKVAEMFAVINRITWAKPPFSTKAEMFDKATMRGYFPASEAIIFAEHYGADNIAKGEAGYAAKCDELRGFVFEPLRAYLDGERARAGASFDAVRAAVGCATGSGLPSHWFTRSQWMLPTRANYDKLRAAFGPTCLRREYEDLRREYEDLRREYEDLRREYEDLRRPFSVSADVPYTDVWTFPTVARYPGKHPCEKPEAMARHIVAASSRPDAVVLDTFAGSGVFAASAVALGRRALGGDMDPHWVAVASKRCANVGNVVPMVRPKRAAPPPSAPRPADERQLDLLARLA